MSASSHPSAERIRKVFVNDIYQLDQNLPAWARRSHPVVKRELGMYWRIMPPQLELPVKAFGVQAIVILATLAVPFLITLLVPMVLVSFAVLPVALYGFARVIYDIANDASRAMTDEVENHTLDLLRTTPIALRELLLSKLAAALWKQSEPFSLILTAASLTQMPVLFILYANQFPLESFAGTAQFVSVIMLLLTLVRLPVDVFMVASLSQAIGAQTLGRGAAQASSIGLMVIYFVLVNLPRLLWYDPFWRVMVDGVLPIVTAAGVSWMSLRATQHHLTRAGRA
jgi:hypothetical protein